MKLFKGFSVILCILHYNYFVNCQDTEKQEEINKELQTPALALQTDISAAEDGYNGLVDLEATASDVLNDNQDDKKKPFETAISVEELDTDLHEDGRIKTNLELKNKDETKEKHELPIIDEQYEAEKKAGSNSDLLGNNPHYSYPAVYKNLNRRFVPQYPYVEKPNMNPQGLLQNIDDQEEIIPVKASPELVLKVAELSTKEEAEKPLNPNENIVTNAALRSGAYWDGFWVEKGTPEMLRSKKRHLKSKVKRFKTVESIEEENNLKPSLSVIKAQIMPGTKLFNLITMLKTYSPRLLYVINKDKE